MYRNIYEKIIIILGFPTYVIYLIAIYFHWIPLTENPFIRYVLLGSVPLVLISLYFTSHKKIFSQRIGDSMQILIAVLVITSANTYFGVRIGVNGPFFLVTILLYPLYALLLDSFLFFFLGGVLILGIIIDFLMAQIETPTFSFLLASDFAFKIIIVIIMSFVFSSLIKRTLTEQKIRHDLQEAYEDLKRLDRAKSEFVSIASHQLRTPLTAIKGYISMILEGTYGKVPEKAERPLENVSQSNERLIKLVNDLLNVSKIEAGRLEMNYEKADIGEIVKSVFEEMKNEAGNKKLYLKTEEPPKELPKVSVDKDKFRQVILNLLDNAIRYTEHGGITVKLQASSYKFQIAISDTGEGMNKDEKEKMFTSFSRGSAGTKLYTEGAGLGLYVAKKFVEMHNGKIWVESGGKGKGSTFFIELPL